jgi:hypothetical protein
MNDILSNIEILSLDGEIGGYIEVIVHHMCRASILGRIACT